MIVGGVHQTEVKKPMVKALMSGGGSTLQDSVDLPTSGSRWPTAFERKIKGEQIWTAAPDGLANGSHRWRHDALAENLRWMKRAPATEFPGEVDARAATGP